MDWIEGEAAWVFFPNAANVFVGRKTFQCLEPTAKVVGGNEVSQAAAQLAVGFVVVALDGRFLEGAVHPLDLPIGPGVVGFGQAVFDAACSTDLLEGVEAVAGDLAVADARQVGELEAVVGQHGVNPIRHPRDQVSQEACSGRPIGLLMQGNEGELGGAVDRHEEVELALLGTNLSNVDVEIADRVGLELALGWCVVVDLRQTRDPVTMQAAMQRRAGQMRDRRLQGIKTIIERQERVPAESDDYRLLLKRQHRRLRMLRTGRQIGDRTALLPLGDGLRIDPVASSQGPQALLTMLYRSTDRRRRRGAAMKNLAHSASRHAGENNAPSKPGIKHLGDRKST